MFKIFKRVKKEVREAEHRERMISLYEKQMAALEALGSRYLCSKLNAQPRKFYGYRGYDVYKIGKQEIFSADFEAPTVFPAKLRVIK